jgi:hypothetical protein
MKAEHRKELQTNELADWMGHKLDSLKTDKRSWTTGLVIVLLVGGAIAGSVYFLRGTSGSAALWGRLNTATDTKELEKLAQEHPNTRVGRAALFEVARIQYQEGLRDLASPDLRASALTKLLKAREQYEQLSAECKDSPQLSQEALMWIAKIDEALINATLPEKPGEKLSDIDRAIQSYQKLGQLTPETFQTKAAAERAKLLQDKRADFETFYTKLNEAAAKPK